MVFELRPAGIDKGTAIREFMTEPPFAGRVPLFLGDDATDEHGFAAVTALGGHAMKVGEGETCADWRVPDVAAVRAWLASILGERSPDAQWPTGTAAEESAMVMPKPRNRRGR
jgi:trehalose 6-phosphate phosphatase